MKKIVLTVAAVLAFGFANAQDKESKGFAKGDMFVEGALQVRSGNTSQGPTDVKTAYTFNPSFGYMINDKVAIGGDIDASSSKFYNDFKSNTFGIGAFARYYFLTLGSDKAFNAFGQAGLGYSTTKDKDNNGNEIDKTSGVKFNIDLGMNYFLTKNWALTFTLTNLVSYNTLKEGGNSTNGLNAQIGTINNPFATAQFGLLYKW